MIGDSDVAHPPRAGDFHGLLALQKKRYPSDEGSLELRMKSEASIRGALTPASEHVDPKLAAENQDINIPEGGASVRSMEHAVSDVGLKPALLFHNRPPAELYEMALRHEAGTHIVQGGALATVSGAKTGRSPKDKRVVRSEDVQADLWWGAGSPNIEMDDHTFMVNRERAIDYLNTLERVHVQDGFVSWDLKRRFKIRVICGRAYHALFMHNMLIRPSKEELREFGEPDFTIYNAGAFPANRHTSYMSSSTSVDISLSRREMVILGTQYAGEMKKGVFSVMHYFMPRVGILSLHSGCNVGADDDVTLFFGLSGTGKTTLSTDPRRPLIGDDEHGWGDDGVFNLEGGCYAKCINLSKDKEPEIYEAIRFGAVLENVIFHDEDRSVDYDATSITENTRAAYPIEHIANARIPCVGPHPRNIILLSCDAFGVLPPVSRLTTEQACYHFISGYTAKVAGTEVGVKEPEATFSACFGGAFLMWHPMKYASMLAEKMEQHKTACWLVNTGWTGGAYGTGSRISLSYTRAIIDAIHSGALGCCDYTTTPVFALQVPTACPGVPDAMLLPEQTWPDKSSFWETLHCLGQLYQANFATYASGGGYVSSELAARITAAGPDLAFVQQVLEGGPRRPDPLGSAAAAAVSTV